MLIKELSRVLGHSSGQTHVLLSSCVPVSQTRLLPGWTQLNEAANSYLVPGWAGFVAATYQGKVKKGKTPRRPVASFRSHLPLSGSTLHSLVSFVLQKPLQRAAHTEGCPNKRWLRGSVGNTCGGRKERGSSRPTEGLLFPDAQRHTEQLKKYICRNML